MRSFKRAIIGLFMVLAVVSMVRFAFVEPSVAFAQSNTVENLDEFGTATGLGNEDPRIIIANIVRIFLGFVGVIAVILIIYAGFLFMTSGGDPGKIDKAKKIMVNAVIGLIIILSSLAITQFVLNALLNATGAGGGNGSGQGTEFIDPFSTSLGAGVIDSHFPARSQTDVARNVLIAVTFREAIDPSSIMDGYDPANPTVALPLVEGAVNILEDEQTPLAPTDVNVSVTPDNRTFVFDPVNFLGSADNDVWYAVELSNSIQRANGEDAFVGAFSDGYTWRFRTGTFVDVTPPQIESVIPFPDSTNPRNILIQINYDEPINPVSASGYVPGGAGPTFTNISATDGASVLEGEWRLLNQYMSNEFISSTPCGTNSCGETIYCLPGNASIDVTVLAADLGADPPQAASVALPNGVTDMYGNSLDGNGDGQASGPSVDSYQWAFDTTNEVILTPPEVVSVVPSLQSPGLPASNVAFDQDVFLTFDTPLALSSVNADNVQLRTPSDSLWYNFQTETFDPDPTDQNDAITDFQSRIEVRHGLFSEEILYGVNVDSGLRSVFQNCFTPSVSNTCTGNDPNCCNENSQATQCQYPEFSLPTP